MTIKNSTKIAIAVFSVLYCLGHGTVSVFATEKLTVENVLSADVDADYGEYLAGECMTCHTGKNTNASIPDIHGKDPGYIVSALIEYRNKTRKNETMRSITSVMGKDEIAALAAYFSSLE